jgi:hypothetical protein
MKHIGKLIAIVSILGFSASNAVAGGSAGSIGVGAEFLLVDPLDINPVPYGGVSMNYDAGEFHVGGYFYFTDPGGGNDSSTGIGGRFYYHLHSTALSDFGVGGAIGIAFIPDPGDPDSTLTPMRLEPGFQIRSFISTNVALSFAGGITIGVGDDDGVGLTGGVNAFAGVHYYFF